MNYEQEILELKALVTTQRAEIDALKAAAQEAKTMIDGYHDIILGMATDLTFAHQKVNSLIDRDPSILADLAALEAIVGPLNRSTPDAPPHS